jgi:hypothetical protein
MLRGRDCPITEVCGQAVKNIHYLLMFSEEEPTDNLKKWAKQWSAPEVTSSVMERIRRPEEGSRKSLERDQLDYAGPTGATRGVVIPGQTLSKSSLEQELAKSTDEAVQAAILLHGTIASIASIGAKMRVFCCK